MKRLLKGLMLGTGLAGLSLFGFACEQRPQEGGAFEEQQQQEGAQEQQQPTGPQEQQQPTEQQEQPAVPGDQGM